MSKVFTYLGWGTAAPAAEETNAVRALPASWYTSKEMYELERRAIFSRRWQIITHSVRIKNPGDFVRFEVAGFNFIVARDRQNKINAFHNVCRHRAYPVVNKDSGNAKIFSCKYHGWSYGLSGQLAKAPGYQDLQSFDKSQNGLLPIHTRIDRNGFVWVNLDGKDNPEVSWEEEFEGVDEQKRYDNYNFDDYEFDHIWEIEANYNWKIAADNYNECYHCATTHPDIPAVANLESYDVNTKASHIQHDPATTEEQRAQGLAIATTYYYPNASTNVSPHFFMMQRFVPHSPTSSTISYQVFRNKHSPEEEFQRIDTIYKRVMSEDKELCNAAQKNLNAGIFVNGEMHPKMEKGPLYFQKVTREMVTQHHAREQKEQREIWPAQQQLPKDAGVSKADIEFCSGLACAPGVGQEQLAW
ncbi:Vacuolar protein sorting-associated protein 72 [Sphaceloma murrayae]|uniref:Choline monooxygenase, chloroplastic n=1 Tax=Sphaceloma murrayae TaxID=2082308 RepID=A0A2K1QXU7_9PEZI|nr:Vacuolar protein sorting-associated protein 72 [Sphaceloma murrayae]